MRFLVFLALVVTVLLSLPSALAIRSASVGSETPVAVVSTDSALLSLSPGTGDGNVAGTAFFRNAASRDVLLLDFTRGLNGGTSYGFPANSLAYRDQFRFRGLFTVTNRSNQALCITIYVPGGGAADLDGIYVRQVGDAGTGTAVASSGGSPLACSASLAAGGTFEVDFWWQIGSGSDGLRTFGVRVEGS